MKNFQSHKQEKVLLETLRSEVAQQGGTSIFINDQVRTILNGEEKKYRVVIELGAYYALTGA